jgi:hypothetical protein
MSLNDNLKCDLPVWSRFKHTACLDLDQGNIGEYPCSDCKPYLIAHGHPIVYVEKDNR